MEKVFLFTLRLVLDTFSHVLTLGHTFCFSYQQAVNAL